VLLTLDSLGLKTKEIPRRVHLTIFLVVAVVSSFEWVMVEPEQEEVVPRKQQRLASEEEEEESIVSLLPLTEEEEEEPIEK